VNHAIKQSGLSNDPGRAIDKPTPARDAARTQAEEIKWLGYSTAKSLW
jgi:hypothetical protein